MAQINKTDRPPHRSKVKQDVSIMETNNSSIASKRSVERLYFRDEPHFFHHFVHKPQRRSPIINRGYWLRMKAIDHVVKHFLESNPGKKKLVINLGCGYDPLPFQCLTRYPELCHGAKFVDVDYDALIARKSKIVSQTDSLLSLLSSPELGTPPATVSFRSDQYLAIGCDLRDLKTLYHALDQETDLSNSLVLFTAEVSITYMDIKAANSVISWAASFDNARFCLLEQIIPDGEDHPFARTMIKHFKKVQSPLNSLGKYPTLEDQTLRFESAGWKTAFARSLWDLWSDDSFLSPQSRISLDEVEPFDEWEEFALFSSHYSLLYAENSGSFTTEPGMRPFLPSLPLDANISVLDSSTPISLKFKEASQYLGLRRFGSAFSLGEDAIAFHGGMGPDTRLDSSEIVTQGSARLEQVAKVPAPGKARMCHTISMVGNGKHLLVGGRASPDAAFADCWLLSSGSWHPVQPLPTPRYRHCAVSVREINVLIFGGKDSAGNPLKESLLWDEEEGWKHLQMAGTQPQARFGASMGALSTTSGILFGGMTGSGTILNDLWEWQLDAKQACISFRDRSDDLSTIPGAAECYARFGATLVQHWGATLVIGGVSSNSLLRKEHEIMAIDTTTFRPKLLPRSESIPRPLLVGCAIHTDGSETLIFGGGAVCYAFGMYWNRGIWVLGESDDSKHSWKFQDIHANSKGLGAGGKPQSENSAPSEKAPLSLP